MHYIGAIATALYIMLVPESPSWLLLNNRNHEAIKSLNWIAFINGSNTRIPENA